MMIIDNILSLIFLLEKNNNNKNIVKIKKIIQIILEQI